MNELIALLKEKAGLSDEQAIKTVHTLKDYLQGKVPPMFSGFVDKFFDGAPKSEDDSFLH